MRAMPGRARTPGAASLVRLRAIGLPGAADAIATVDFRGVSGIVSLWGRLQAHRDHVRAEYARVEALALYAGWSGRQRAAVTSIARQLGADLVDLWEQRNAADAYGTALRPLSGSATVP